MFYKQYLCPIWLYYCKENHSTVPMTRSLLYKVIENHLKSRDDDSLINNDFRNTVILFELTKRFDQIL